MKTLKVLDCTLRDGGYCNNWEFGERNVHKIIRGLSSAGIDIVECGFLTSKTEHNSNITKFNHVEEMKELLFGDHSSNMYVCMVNYGEYDPANLPQRREGDIDGLRVAFHKKDMIPALSFSREVKNRGYHLFIQAMVSLCYTDEEFLDLIRRVNEIRPYAFYIVDSFGVMKRKDLVRLFYMVEHNLAEGIAIGFHSHNNMQLSYSNAQTLVDIQTNRDLIIDSSVFGMGRGAGNLNTELFVDYLNEHMGSSYRVEPLLSIIDEVLEHFFEQQYWGYSLPNYLSAAHNAHPNYAGYYADKQTLTFETMNEIFEMMDEQKRFRFDQKYAEEMYLIYMSKSQIQMDHEVEWKQRIQGKKILLIAPGKSVLDEKETVIEFVHRKDVCSISINYDYPYADADFIFLSNLRRYRELAESKRSKCIVTSNIRAGQVYLQTRYSDLLGNDATIRDNAGLMALRFLVSYGCREVYLAGFDGYSHDAEANYFDSNMSFVTRTALLEARNKGMIKELNHLSKKIRISFLTMSRYLKLNQSCSEFLSCRGD